jgi:putative oxidoreductase
MLHSLDDKLIRFMNRWSVPILRLALAIVFIWFGWLKVQGASPVEDLVRNTFASLPFDFPFTWLGILEIAIGLGLLFKFGLRFTLLLLWLMLLGTFSSLFLNPSLFFDGNLINLTTEGEFVIKNLVLFAAGLVIGGFEVRFR